MMAMQILSVVEERWKEKRMGLFLISRMRRLTRFAVWCGQTTSGYCCIHTHKFGKMLQDIIEEAKKWDLLSLAASLWWTSTFEGEEKQIWMWPQTEESSSEENFKILGCVMNRRGKTLDANEERMQSANKACWKDFKIHNNKDCLMDN